MKVALILTTRWWRGSIDHDGYAESLRKMNHDPVLFCLGNDAGLADFPVVITSASEMESVDYWRSQRIDVAIVWNWLRGSRTTLAMRDAGVKVILRADSDGLCSNLVFPVESFMRIVENGCGIRSRLGLAKYFFFKAFKGAKQEDQELLATLSGANSVIVETMTAKQGLEKLLVKYGQLGLADKITVVPHSVRDSFLAVKVAPVNFRRRQIVASGRWDSRQKNPELLVNTLKILYSIDPSISVVVCGRADEETRASLAKIGTGVRYVGLVGAEEMIRLLNESQTLLSTSRWETQPIGALEAICSGCTVVAPPIRGFIDLLADPRCGTLATSSRAKSLVFAAQEELKKWQLGQRKPYELADHYRERLSNATVIREIMTTVSSA